MLSINFLSNESKNMPLNIFDSSLSRTLFNKKLCQYRILLIEDNPINQRVAYTYLTELGFHKIDVAYNGYDALVLSRQYCYSLILQDIDLPDISGFEVIKAIKKSFRNKNTPVAFVTNHSEKQIVKKCFDLGAIIVLTKPLNFNLLKENMQLWLSNNNQQNCSL